MNKILFVSAACPPGKAGSNIVMKHILDMLDRDFWRYITVRREEGTCDAEYESRILRISSKMLRLGRFGFIPRLVDPCRYYFSAMKFAKKFKPTVVISVYPSLGFMILGVLLAKSLKIPYIPYMHDTIVESFSKRKYSWFVNLIQCYIFANSSKIMVMSEGIAALYRKKYGIDAVAIEHIYPERIVDEVTPNAKRMQDAFWAGSVYSINDAAVRRVFEAVSQLGMSFTFTDRMSRASLSALNIEGENLNIVSLPTRKDYLYFLAQRGIAILALNDTDESSMGNEELSTIFPTKTPEYLAAGLPILVHCPESYFIAKFFKEHKCGIVVSDKSISAIMSAIKKLQSDTTEMAIIRHNAIMAAKLFTAGTVMKKFNLTIESCCE